MTPFRSPDASVDRPIFFVGAPRSGTTVLFEIFAARDELAWPSQYLERAPGLRFMGGFHAFPGGKAHPDDAELAREGPSARQVPW